jgi:Xaa-Pro dipeptidase
MNLLEIQQALREEGLDGWLFFDHHQRDTLAYRVLGFTPGHTPTRRWYYLIPAEGEPVRVVHQIEPGMLDALPGSKVAYASWTRLLETLQGLLTGRRRIAMQYSPNCAVPYVAMVDAGTVELIRSLGVEVVSSANLVQFFEARWNQRKLESHLEAGRKVDAVRRAAFERASSPTDEYQLQQFILQRFKEEGLTTDHGPIVAVNANASNPHYEPTAEVHRSVQRGDVLLIDMWAKLDRADSVYYDITWVGYCGSQPPEAVRKVFGIVREARERAVRRVQDAVASHETLCGYQVDDAARGYICEQGYGEYFFHRTGHSIGADVHGTGANMDNLETHDERRVISWTCFSVEPGIYLPDFGIRSEVNVFVDELSARVTGEAQQELVLI